MNFKTMNFTTDFVRVIKITEVKDHKCVSIRLDSSVSYKSLPKELQKGYINLTSEASAICHKEDNFDLSIGRLLATGRAYKKLGKKLEKYANSLVKHREDNKRNKMRSKHKKVYSRIFENIRRKIGDRAGEEQNYDGFVIDQKIIKILKRENLSLHEKVKYIRHLFNKED